MESEQKSRGCLWMSAGCAVGVVVALVLGIVAIRTTFHRLKMRGVSMAPTLVEGDLLLMREAKQIRRGDIVAYENPVDGTLFLHRVIALPGESIAIRDNVAILGGVPLDEPYAWTERKVPALRDHDPVRVPAGTYFVLGDNRDHANDSRFIGFVPRENIRARVVFVISPKTGPRKP